MAMNAPDSVRGRAIAYSAAGGLDVITMIERVVRPPAVGEVRIAVKAAAVNHADVLLRQSGFRPGQSGQDYPLVPGLDAAGIIEAIGPGVSRLRCGQAVMACVGVTRPEGGAQAQHIVVPAASVVPMPNAMSFAQACTLPMNGLTALHALELAALEEGQYLAVSGGAGLVAHYAIAIAKHHGLRVIADAKAEELELVRSYGADIVVERCEDFAGAVRHAVPQGVDALLDTAVRNEQCFGAIRDAGTYVAFRFWQGKPPRGIKSLAASVFGVFDLGKRTEWLAYLSERVESKSIRLRVEGEFAPERAGDAQTALQAGGIRGRPVLIF